MMKKTSLIVIIYTLACTICTGQTEMLDSQYLFDKTFITPANFSQEEPLRLFTNYQSTSGKGRGGEEYLYSASAHYKMDNEKNLFGMNVVSGRFGQENVLLGYMNYTYNILLSDRVVLSNGLGMGFQQYRLNLDDGQGVVQVDPTLSGNIYSSKFDFRMGVTAVIDKRAYFGVSFDNILSQYNNQNDKDINYLPESFRRINMTFMAGNVSALSTDVDFRYEGIYTYNFGGVSSLDLSTSLIIGDIIGGGLSYRRHLRSEEGGILPYGILRPFLTLNLSRNQNSVKLNYAYGMSPHKINTVGLNTHEIGVLYSLRKR